MGWWLKIRLYYAFQAPPSKRLCFQNLASVVKGRTGWKISWLGARKTLSQQINGESTKLAGSFTRDEEQREKRHQILKTIEMDNGNYNENDKYSWRLRSIWSGVTVHADMEFLQKFTPLDFRAKNFTPSISPNFNSFSKKTHKKMSENGEIYTAGKNFTLPPAVTALTNFTSACSSLDKWRSHTITTVAGLLEFWRSKPVWSK